MTAAEQHQIALHEAAAARAERALGDAHDAGLLAVAAGWRRTREWHLDCVRAIQRRHASVTLSLIVGGGRG